MYRNHNEMNFRANGKLLLTAEYLVLHGAKALAIPLKFGQNLSISPTKNSQIEWEAFTPKGLWFSASYDAQWNITKCSNIALAKRLKSILKKAVELSTLTTHELIGNKITTKLEFQSEWGFGSSSTLVSLLAQWLQINPYELLALTFGGSGYDIASATSNKPTIYQTAQNYSPTVIDANFNPPFTNNILFFYLGQKQTSAPEVVKFQNIKPSNELIAQINDLTNNIVKCPTLLEFQELLKAHEQCISNYIGMPSINQTIEIDSTVFKSLGAWGGDFAMAATSNVALTREKLNKMGYTTQFAYNNLLY